MKDPEMIELEKAIGEIWDVARGLGLDPFPTHFEMVPANIIYEFGAYLLPGRFSHWTHGKAFYQLKTAYDYGLSKMYEMVINANPAYAFLLDTNSLVQNKFVAAHVFGHVDFFKNNAYFASTSRDMMDSVAVNADRIRSYEFAEGAVEVEKFLDAVLSIAEHIDPFPRREKAKPAGKDSGKDPMTDHPYADLFEPAKEANPPPGKKGKPKKFPEEPEKDLLWFLARHAADLESWQRDIIDIVRSETLYFVPQIQTKIMNEGWATYWHSRIMREIGLSDREYTEFAQLHASICTPSRSRLNPYYVGFKIFEDIEKRAGEGEKGRKKIFEVREEENDASLIRSYLTKELVEELDLYVYRLDGQEWKIVEKDWEKVRDTIVESFTNLGHPYIVVEDGDYRGNRELYLRHHFDGRELDVPYAEKTLAYVRKIWGRNVHLETNLHDRKVVFTCDGGNVTKTVF